MLVGTACILLSLWTIGYVRWIGHAFGFEPEGSGDTVGEQEVWHDVVQCMYACDLLSHFRIFPLQPASQFTMVLAVGAFYLLDFAINMVQASARTLMVDVLPVHQQQNGTAWASAMIGIGNVAGYFAYDARA